MALGMLPRKRDVQCRSAGCFQQARWKCMIVMPAPPGLVERSGSMIVKDGTRGRLFSGVCVCDRHRADATVVQVLGPIGYPAICAAFKSMRKVPPPMGDLSVDFESLEHAPILDS